MTSKLLIIKLLDGDSLVRASGSLIHLQTNSTALASHSCVSAKQKPCFSAIKRGGIQKAR
jgi:hypothetical protein